MTKRPTRKSTKGAAGSAPDTATPDTAAPETEAAETETAPETAAPATGFGGRAQARPGRFGRGRFAAPPPDEGAEAPAASQGGFAGRFGGGQAGQGGLRGRFAGMGQPGQPGQPGPAGQAAGDRKSVV